MHMPKPFDVATWVRSLNDLVDILEQSRDVPAAIECLAEYDIARKRIDRIQGYPEYGAITEIERYKK